MGNYWENEAGAGICMKDITLRTSHMSVTMLMSLRDGLCCSFYIFNILPRAGSYREFISRKSYRAKMLHSVIWEDILQRRL